MSKMAKKRCENDEAIQLTEEPRPGHLVDYLFMVWLKKNFSFKKYCRLQLLLGDQSAVSNTLFWC
jgi:hypothetical protein